MIKRTWLVMSLVMTIGLVGCSTTKVKRVEVEEVIDLSGEWNDTDAMLVAEEMIDDSLSRSWLMDFVKKNGRNPVVIVGNVVNRSHEHINADVVVKYLERELLNSGEVQFVANPTEREGIRGEREDQQKGYTDTATMAKMGREVGADYMMIGSINSTVDEIKRESVIFYQVNLELIDLSTNVKVWVGQKQIKKYVKRPRFSM